MDKITVNGETYVRETTRGPRYLVVVRGGWIFAGDVEDDGDFVRLTRCTWMFRFEGTRLDGMIANPKDPRVKLYQMPAQSVDIRAHNELYRIPVSDDWGL